MTTDLPASERGPRVLAPLPGEELAAGTLVGEYCIERMIGYGGMGVVYGARHPVIGKRAAVKVLSTRYSVDREAVSRFVQEAQAVNQIGHTNIVDIFAFGSLPDGRSYFVMEWLQGETLMDRIRRSRLTAAEAIPLLIALTRALEAAHAAGVIHRDLKPENVFLATGDDAVRVKLLDFGIAKLSSQKPVDGPTATGVVVGTPLFMSPEQARGHAVDARSDVYALGALAYNMVCGTAPFEDEPSSVEVLAAHIHKKPLRPSALAPALPSALEDVILDLLAKDPAERPALAAVRRRLSRLATEPNISAQLAAQADPHGTEELRSSRHVTRARRRRLIAGAAVAAAVATVVAIVALARDGDEAAPPAAPAVGVEVPPQPPAAPASGTVELAVEPATATATIDGAPVALDGGHARIALAPGRHALATSAPGHRPAQQSFDIASAQTTPLAVRLRPQQRPPARPKPAPDTDAVVNPFPKRGSAR